MAENNIINMFAHMRTQIKIHTYTHNKSRMSIQEKYYVIYVDILNYYLLRHFVLFSSFFK